MKEIELPTGQTVIYTGSDDGIQEYQELMQNRHDFSMNYAKDKGWMKEGEGFESLSIMQIMEIGEQEGWKTP